MDMVRRLLGCCDIFLTMISKIATISAAVLIALISLFICGDVISRGVFDHPIIGVAEVVSNALIIIAFLQLPYTIRIGGMLRTQFVDDLMSPLFVRAMKVLGYTGGAGFFFVVAYSQWDLMIRSYVTGEFEGHVSFAVPVFPSRLTIVCGSIFAGLVYAVLCLKEIFGIETTSSSATSDEEVGHADGAF